MLNGIDPFEQPATPQLVVGVAGETLEVSNYVTDPDLGYAQEGRVLIEIVDDGEVLVPILSISAAVKLAWLIMDAVDAARAEELRARLIASLAADNLP